MEVQPAPELNGAQVAAQGASTGLEAISRYQHGRGQSEDFASLEELLRGAGPVVTGSKERSSPEGSTADKSHIAKEDCKMALHPGSRRGVAKETPILLDDDSSEDEEAEDPRREAGGSQAHGHDVATFEQLEKMQSGERDEEEGVRSTSPASDAGVGDFTFDEKNALPASSDPPLSADGGLLPPTSNDNDGASGGEAHKTPDPEPLARRSEDNTEADDEAEKQEYSSEPVLTPNRRRNGDPASGQAETRGERAETQRSGSAAARGLKAKRGRRALRSGNSNTVPRADHNGSETDDEIDIRPPSKKRTKVRTLPERRTSAPKFEYPPGWPYPWARRTASDRGKAVGSQEKPVVVQDEEPAARNGRTSTQTDSSIPKADHADVPADLTTPVPSPQPAMDHQPRPVAPSLRPKQATDHQPGPIAPLPRPKRALGQEKAAHLESQQWEIKKIASKRQTRRGWEYKVVWVSSWLPRSELGNARRLVRKFESKDSAQRKSKRDRPARDSSSED